MNAVSKQQAVKQPVVPINDAYIIVLYVIWCRVVPAGTD